MIPPPPSPDPDQLIRDCDFPAILDDPLRLLMFPSSNPTTFKEEIQSKIDELKELLQSSEIIFLKVCRSAGASVRFDRWTTNKLI